MKEEIFGPILPVLEFTDISHVIEEIRERPKPLSLYIFSENKQIQDRVLNELSFGGGCINDIISHIATPYMPFGGVGSSGVGSYHGKYSFETFSNKKSILKKSTKFDIFVFAILCEFY
jgi:aldehyde dehydrogenase (NAD+)